MSEHSIEHWMQACADLERENTALRKALDDIAGGMVPAGQMPDMGDRDRFRYEMWLWSQTHARLALKKVPEAADG